MKRVWDYLISEIIAVMESISRAFDRLPTWAKTIWMVFTVLASVYCIARYGFLSFLLHMIFSPL
jgi:hypothetical protein